MPAFSGIVVAAASGISRRLNLLILILAMAVTGEMAIVSAAHAASCRVGGAQSPLQRQLAAIQRFEKQRQCASRGTRGLFNPCRDLASQRKAVLRKLGDNPSCASKVAIKRVERQSAKRVERRLVQTAKRKRRPAALAGAAALYCVRPSDGYFFPAPNSQYLEAEDIPNAVDQCRFICNDPTVELYQLASFDLETDDMVSADGRSYYRDLPNAFAYRSNAEFTACNHQRYYAHVAELRARTVTPTDLANAIIPLPTFRPDIQVAGDDLAVDSVSYEQTSALPEREAEPSKSINLRRFKSSDSE